MKSITTLTASTVTFSSLSFIFNVELAKSTMSMIMQFTTEANISAISSSVRSNSDLASSSIDLAFSRSNSSKGISPFFEIAGNLPGAPKVSIFASNSANSGACAPGATSLLRSVSRAFAFFFEKIPSFLFGFTLVEVGSSSTNVEVGIELFGSLGLSGVLCGGLGDFFLGEIIIIVISIEFLVVFIVPKQSFALIFIVIVKRPT
mmetsp:Transcript_13024/g.26497  ORF Transcript_13024/g.26497 Transcript_13024/m.26497 type:complete len:204 (-) Transcript_13024:1748-2359(-)